MKITFVTTMRNEAPYALEWIAHHRALGVTRFLIFTNDCEDGTPGLLKRLPDVTHIALERGSKPPQWRALKAAWEHDAIAEADWAGCFDCDEFIALGPGLDDLPAMIARAEADAICLRWRLFGSAGQVVRSEQAVTERFTRAAPDDLRYPPLGAFVKTLFRVDGPFREMGVHRPRQKNPRHHGLPVIVDGDGAPVPDAFVTEDRRIMLWGRKLHGTLAQLNHYALRSAQEFLIKRDRGLPNRVGKKIDLTYWVERNFNTVEDSRIARHRDAMQAELLALRDLPGVVEAEAGAHGWHRDRIERLLIDPEILALYGRLILARDSQPPSPELARELVRLYGVAHG